jgi:DNA mismatch endonuclease Vsr
MSSVAEPTLRTPEQVSEVMRRISSSRTEPELSFHRALRRAGVRSFRVCAPELPGKPDIILPSKRLAIFIDGDFWHGHQYAHRGHASLDSQLNGIHNQAYWTVKIRRNVERDFRNTSLLIESGWKVLRFWESDVKKDVDRCVRVAIAATGVRPTRKAAFSALPKKSVIEMFAGIGLVRLALQKRDWRVVFANDNDPQKLEMYSENFGAQHYRMKVT